MENNITQSNNQDFKNPESSVDPQEIKQDLARLDSNGDDILWKYRERRIDFFITLILSLPFVIFFCNLLVEGIHKFSDRSDTSLFMTLLLLFGAFLCIYPSYRLIKLFNQKALYLTEEHIIVEKYIGKTIRAPLGVSYTSIDLDLA